METEPLVVIAVVTIAALPGLLLYRMPVRLSWHALQMAVAAPMLVIGFVGALCLVWFPEAIIIAMVVTWFLSLGFCWWLPIHQRKRKAAAAAARRKSSPPS